MANVRKKHVDHDGQETADRSQKAAPVSRDEQGNIVVGQPIEHESETSNGSAEPIDTQEAEPTMAAESDGSDSDIQSGETQDEDREISDDEVDTAIPTESKKPEIDDYANVTNPDLIRVETEDGKLRKLTISERRQFIKERKRREKEKKEQEEKRAQAWYAENTRNFKSVLDHVQSDDEEFSDAIDEAEGILSADATPKVQGNVSFSMKRNNFDGGPTAISEILAKQKEYYDTCVTISFKWRGRALGRLNSLFRKYEKPLLEAVRRDLGICAYEAYLTEIAPVYEEFRTVRDSFREWTDPHWRRPSWRFLPTKFSSNWRPLGCACIINSWQSPILGAMTPLISALAAGCTVVLKNSSRTKRVNEVLAVMIDELFKPECVRFIFGDEKLDKILANAGFNKIFYCGRRESAVAIMQGAALNLTSPTLVLDGNCPVLVEKSCDIDLAATRTMWGKMLHAGQMRISPSWACVHESMVNQFINRTYEYVKKTYGDNPMEHPDYPKMFSKAEYDEACALLEGLGAKSKIVYGGQRDPKKLKIAPTVVLVDSFSHSIFKKRIIGPILPVVSYDRPETAFSEIGKLATPPSIYLFTKNKQIIWYAEKYVDSGDGCINDTMMHMFYRRSSTSLMGSAGMGYAGGKRGVESFGARRTLAKTGKHFVRKFRFMPFPKSLRKLQKFFKTGTNKVYERRK